MDIDCEIFAWLERGQLFLEDQGVGAQIDIFPAIDESFDDFRNLRMQQGFASGDADHWSAAFFGSFKALLWRQMLFQDMCRILNFAASGAGQIAAEQRLKHQHQRVSFLSRQPFA